MTVALTRAPVTPTPEQAVDTVGHAGTGQRARWMCPALIALAAGVAIAALLGPLTNGAIHYHLSVDALNQVVGGDFVALVLVVPVSLFASLLAWRRHPAAPVVALGPAVFAVYTYTQLTIGGDFARYAGNSERFFVLHLAIFVLGSAIALKSWASIDARRLRPMSRRSQRLLGSFVIVVALFVVIGLHLPTLIDAWRDRPTRPEYLADPGVFWVVKLMDLGIVVPTLTAVGVGLIRGAGWAHNAIYGVVGWFALLGSSVAAMAVVMHAKDDPAASTTNTVAFGLFALVGLTVAVRLLFPLLARRSWTPARSAERTNTTASDTAPTIRRSGFSS